MNQFCLVNVSTLTRLLHPQLDRWIFVLLPFEPQHFSLPLSLAGVLLDLPLGLPVDSEQPRAEDLVKTKEDVPVVVDEEQIIGIIDAPQLLGPCVAEEELGLGRAAAAWQAVVLLGAILVHLQVIFLLLFVLFLHIRELTPPCKQHVRDEVVDDLFDLVLVFLLDAHLPLDMVNDQGSGVLQDLAVVIAQGHVRAAGWRRGVVL